MAQGIEMMEFVNENQQDTIDTEVFIEKLRELGGKSGNKKLRDRLDWSEEKYWRVRGALLDAGRVIKGAGKGGSTLLPVIDPELIVPGIEAADQAAVLEHRRDVEHRRENDLYKPAQNEIEKGWVKEANYDDYRIAITAAMGRAATGGKWSRPDVSVLATKAFPYLPSRLFDIITFEIKPAGQITVEGVFEALSHQQFATRAFVIFHLPEEGVDFLEQPNAERILSTARRHGVGVIVAQNIADWETWDELVPAARSKPDPEQANRFIASCFSQSDQEQIIKWHK